MVWIGDQEADGRMETRTQEQDSGIREYQEQEVDGTRGQERLGQVKWLGKSSKMFALTLLHLFALCNPRPFPSLSLPLTRCSAGIIPRSYLPFYIAMLPFPRLLLLLLFSPSC
jgi:hypothetical protein